MASFVLNFGNMLSLALPTHEPCSYAFALGPRLSFDFTERFGPIYAVANMVCNREGSSVVRELVNEKSLWQ